jgi:alkanesulfonate monooxygenase SsuD/methylene tetrahydromethanopterin reductase-like flavin-dependent oxidoreductase (luciferase family)
MSPGALRLIGSAADGWVPGGGMSAVATFPQLIDIIDNAAAAAGRDPSTIRRVVNLSGTIGEPAAAQADDRYTPGAGVLNGPPSQWIDTLSDWAANLGIDSFVLWPAEPATEQIELFASIAATLRS